jgi:uncharacterized delta-60 repeat protein
MYQADGAGDAMFARSDGTPNTGFGPGGKVAISFPEGAANPKWGAMQGDGKYVAAGNVDVAGDAYVALARVSATGIPDAPAFGDAGGRKIHNFFVGRPEVAWDGFVAADGDIVMVGTMDWPDARVNNALVMRFDANGQPDLTFNGTGVLEVDHAGYDMFKAIVPLESGSYLALGCSCDPFVDDHPLIARVRSDGTLDPSFGTGGVVEPTTWGTDAIIEDALVLASGKLLVSGQRDTGSGMRGFVARIDAATGALDATYGTLGIVEVPTMASTGGLDLASPDGAAWLAGRSGTGPFNAMLARITSGGVVDTSWSGTGVATVDVGAATNDSSYGVLAAGDGSAYVGGDASGDMHVLALRNSSVAPLDTSFSSDGKTTADFGGGYDFAVELFWGREGTIMSVGTAVVGNADFGFFALAGGSTIPDYGGAAVFGSANTQAAFGACLEGRSGSGVTGGWTLDGSGSCTAVVGDPWNAIADTPADASAKVLGSPTVGVVDATATIRFGVKSALATPGRSYAAPIVLEVVAPNSGAVNNPPNVPTLVSPANAAVDPSNNAMIASATFSDPDAGDTGRVEFQLCSSPACGTIVTTANSPNGIVNGANGSATICGTPSTTEHWRARNVDAGGLSSAWSATRSYTFAAGVSC